MASFIKVVSYDGIEFESNYFECICFRENPMDEIVYMVVGYDRYSHFRHSIRGFYSADSALNFLDDIEELLCVAEIVDVAGDCSS